MKLALAMIIKGDSGELLARCLDSVRPYVDDIYITTTQVKDGDGAKVAKQFGAHVSHFQWVDDFAAARNFNFSQVPKEYEYIMWLDDDDVLIHGEKIKDVLLLMQQQKLDAAFMRYNYEIDEKGQVNVVQVRERIVRRDAYEWKAALHETLIAKRETRAAQTELIWVNHFPPKEALIVNAKRNVRILEKMYKAEGEKHDPRTEYYLARSYYDLGLEGDDTYLVKSEKLLWNYLEHSGWDEERAFALNYLAEIYRTFKRYDDAIDCLFSAIKEKENFPTFYINLGLVYGHKKMWGRAVFWTERGLSIPMPKTPSVLNPLTDKARALNTLYLAAMARNRLEEAKELALRLLKLAPTEKQAEDVRKMLAVVEDMQKRVHLARGVERIIKELDNDQERAKIETLLGALPQSMGDNAFIEEMRKAYLKPKKWPKKSIAWFCGKGFEPWSPENLKTGIGGSETAVIELSKHWARMGYDVTVFGYPKEEKDWDGVHYKQYWRFNHQDTFDTLIIWRNPWILDRKYNANRVFLDLHDVINPHELTEGRLKNVDKIFVKSNYHRNFAPDVPDNKFVVIPNGVNPDLFDVKGDRRPYKVIYASSYDRGLEYMLRYGWPVIKKEIPEAELNIFYGWNLFDSVHKDNPERMNWKGRMLDLMKQDGVTERGRVGKDRLAKEFAESQILYYATTFEEIDCITVRQGAITGAVPFTTDYSAIKERPYCVRTKGDPYDKETQEAVAMNIVKYLKDPKLLEQQREKSLTMAKNETWENIAKSWINEI
jgi:tetratricopeptide (TPR) repeat protein